jgi:tripartite-type tricarboxylate transporter receptor subunit TctC
MKTGARPLPQLHRPRNAPAAPARRRVLLGAALAGWLPVRAAALPVEQPRFLYGFPPGSGGDIAARRVAERIGGSAYARRAALVDNRAGAGGRIALESLKGAPADGSVLALTPLSTLAIYPHVYRKLGYDPVADFAPVGLAALAHHGLAVGPLVPASVRDAKGFVAWARAHPAQANFGSPAAGSTPHFIGALLGLASGVALRHVPYRGSMPGIADLMGGQIAAMCTPAGDFIAPHRAGRLRLLATSGRQRLPFTPDVATFAEQGLPELTVEEWFGFCAPARTPAAVIAAAHAAIAAALAAPDLAEGLATVGLLVHASTPQQMAHSQREELQRWGPLVRRVGFSAES